MEIKKWRGLRNTTSTERFNVGELETAQNVDIDNTGRVMTREGQVQVSSIDQHSLFANHVLTLAVLRSTKVLSIVESAFTYTSVRVLTNNNPVSYETSLDNTYYSNGVDLGRFVGRAHTSWGITPPVGQPAAVATSGSLPPGTYMYALTFLRSDGQESGTGIAGSVDLPIGGGIQFTGIEVSTNPDVYDKIVYISGGNGGDLFRAFSLANSVTTTVYRSGGLDLTIPLLTQFAVPPPAGHIVRLYNGRMYVVAGDIVYFSDPYSFELFRPDVNYLRFPIRVAMFEPVNDGIYVGTGDIVGEDTETNGKVWFLSGEAGSFKSVQLYDYGVTEGSATKTGSAYFESEYSAESEGEQSDAPVVVWANRHGICAGFDGGKVQNYTEAKVSLPSASRGASIVMQTRGFSRYVVSLQGAGEANNKYEEEI